jgi:SAM-dependent MidA family methyltransferase
LPASTSIPSGVLFFIIPKKVMIMKLSDHLSEKQKQQLDNLKKKQEKVNWKEIMGMNRDRYTRKNGAMRRK